MVVKSNSVHNSAILNSVSIYVHVQGTCKWSSVMIEGPLPLDFR